MIAEITIIIANDFWADPRLDWVISAGMFISVVLGVLGMFSGGGNATISAQRAAAIATGHDDRKTVFENPVLRPLLWLLLSIAAKLNLESFKKTITKKLISSGNPDYYTAEEYLALSFFYGVVFAIIMSLFYYLIFQSVGVTMCVIGLLFGTTLSIAQLFNNSANRLNQITKQLPYSLELISLAMGAGATFGEAIKTVIREDRDNPLNEEFLAMLSEMDFGTTRSEALSNVAKRVPLDSVRTIVASVKQAEELGTPLTTVLRDQATLLRMQRSVRAEDLAASASVKILIPSLLLVAAVILVVFGPWIVKLLVDGMF